MILGRFNPDGFVLGAWFFGVMMAVVVPAAAVFTVGVSGLLRMCSYSFGTASGLTSTAVVLAVVAFGILRSRGWDE